MDAWVAELADAEDFLILDDRCSKILRPQGHVGSSPTPGTQPPLPKIVYGAELNHQAAVARHQGGQDIVGRGDDTDANRRLAETIEAEAGSPNGGSMAQDTALGTQEQSRSQTDLAGRLLARLGRLEACGGDVSLATEIQLLKRELVRGHTLLASRPGDNDYLSAVTLVEAALASLRWKAYTPQVFGALRK